MAQTITPIPAITDEERGMSPLEGVGPEDYGITPIPAISEADYEGVRAFPGQGVGGYKGGTFGRGIDRGVKQTAGLFGQLMKLTGDEFGFAGMADIGDDLIREALIEALANPAEIHGFEDIDTLGDVGTWVMQTFGEQIPNLALAITGGGLGGGLASYAAKQGVTRAMLNNVAKRAVQLKLDPKDFAKMYFAKGGAGRRLLKEAQRTAGRSAAKKGAGGGLFGALFPVNTGEIIQEQRDAFESVENQSNRNPNRAIEEPDLFWSAILGTPSTLLDVVGLGLVGKAVFGKAKKEVVGHTLNTVLRRTGHVTLASLKAEGGTEAMQEAIVIASRKINDPTFSITDAIASSEGLRRIAFAGASGALVGGALGGVGGVATSVSSVAQLNAKRARIRAGDGVAAIRESFAGRGEVVEGEAQPAPANSLFDFSNATPMIAGIVKGLSTLKDKAATAVASLKNNEGVHTIGSVTGGIAATLKRQADVSASLNAELEQTKENVERINDNRDRVTKVLKNINDEVSQIPTIAEKDGKNNDAAHKISKLITEKLDAAKKLSIDKRAETAAELLTLLEELTAKAIKDPTSIAKGKLQSLHNSVKKFSLEGFAKLQRDNKAYTKKLNFWKNRVNSALKGLPTAEELEDIEVTAAERAGRFEDSGETTGDQLTLEEQAEDRAVVAAEREGRAEQSRMRTARKKVVASAYKVLKGVTDSAYAVGYTSKNLPGAVQSLVDSGKLKATNENGETLLQLPDNPRTMSEQKEFDFPTQVENLNPEQTFAVTNTTRETLVDNTEDALAEKAKNDAIGEETVFKTVDEVVEENLTDLNEEAAAKTTTVRFYGNNGNFLAETTVERDEDAVDAAIAAFRAQYGIEGFAVANDKQAHKERMNSNSVEGQVYRSMWEHRALIRAGKPLPPDTVIIEVDKKPTLLRRILHTVSGRRDRAAIRKGDKKLRITLKQFREAREDAEYIIQQSMNLVQKNNDPAAWAEKAIRHPELEEQTALYAKQVDQMVNEQLGSAGLFSNLVDQPRQHFGVSVNKNGGPSTQIVEIHQDGEGNWLTVGGKPAFKFTEKDKSKLEAKLNNATSVAQFNRYGLKEAVGWNAEVVTLEDGTLVIELTMPGVDNSIIFNQVRKVEDRGADTRKPGQAKYGVGATAPDGRTTVLHLGSITELGRLQRLGPGNLLLGNRMTQAHENFMYGLATMLNLGYVIDDVSQTPFYGLFTPNVEAQQASAQMRKAFEDKVIYGDITFRKSLASQKSLFALERFIQRIVKYPKWAGGREHTIGSIVIPEEGGMSLAEMVDVLIDAAMESEIAGYKTGSDNIVVERIRDKQDGTIYYATDKYTLEPTASGIVVRERPKNKDGTYSKRLVGKKAFFKGKRVAVLPSTILTIAEANTEGLSAPERLSLKERRMKNVRTPTTALAEALVASEQITSGDMEELSMLISLSGLYDHSLSSAINNITTDANAVEGESNFIDAAASNEAIVNAEEESGVVMDDSATVEEFSEVEFQERSDRGRLGENESKEVPFKARVKETKVPKATTNMFMPAGKRVRNMITGWAIGKPLRAVLKKLNIKENIILFDDAAIPQLLTEFRKVANNTNNPEITRKLANLYIESLEATRASGKPGRIHAQEGPINERVVLIYVPKDAKGGRSKVWRLAHELGHLVEYVHLNSLSAELQKEIYDAVAPGRDRATQREVFANYMAAEIVKDTKGFAGKTALDKALQDLVGKLRIVYEWARRVANNRFTSAAEGNYAGASTPFIPGVDPKLLDFLGFVSGMHSHAAAQQGLPAAVTPMGKRFFDDLQAASSGPYIRSATFQQVDEFPGDPIKDTILAPFKVARRNVGLPLPQESTEGICNGTCGMVTGRLKKNGFAYGRGDIQAKSPLGDWLIGHVVALARINGETYIVNQPQGEFMGSDFNIDNVWEDIFDPDRDIIKTTVPGSMRDHHAVAGINVWEMLKGEENIIDTDFGPQDVNQVENIQTYTENGETWHEANFIADKKAKVRWNEETDAIEFRSSKAPAVFTNENFTPRLIKVDAETLAKTYGTDIETAKANVAEINKIQLESGEDITTGAEVFEDNFDDTIDAAVERTQDSVLGNVVEDFNNLAKTFKDDPILAVKTLIRPADAELRSMGPTMTRIAKMFRSLPGVIGESGATIFRKIQMRGGPFHRAAHAMFKSVPSMRMNLWEIMNPRPSAATKAKRAHRNKVSEALLLQTKDAELSAEIKAEVRMIRQYFKDIHTWYTSTGTVEIHMQGTNKTMPVEGMGLELNEWGYLEEGRPAYYPMMVDSLFLQKNEAKFMKIMVNNGWTDVEADNIRMKIIRDEDGGLNNGFQASAGTDNFFGPGFSSGQARNKEWTPKLRAELVEAGFYQHDIATTITAYTEMIVRRAVWQTEFSESRPLQGELLKRYQRFGDDVNMHGPAAKLQLWVHEARARGEINEWQFNRVIRDILPAYAGQLGLRTNSKLRKLNSGIIIYQNFRLLPFAIFSQYVDVGTMAARGDFKSAQAGMAGMLNKTTREEAREMMEILGAIRQGITEHVLSEQALSTFSTSTAKRMNDMFFHYNLMEGWTNGIRVMAAIAGREFITRNARRAVKGDVKSRKKLASIGLSTEREVADAAAWEGFTTGNEAIDAALLRFVDESMIRPDPTMRPVHMSDASYVVFNHLKNFLWGFYGTFIKRGIYEAKVHHNLLPLFTLGMMALPFAALGYELRRKLLGTSKHAPEGGQYLMELTERAGLLGPWQLVADMEQADDYGNPAILALGGPAIEQFASFVNKDMSYWVPRAIPVVASVPAMRDWARDLTE